MTDRLNPALTPDQWRMQWVPGLNSASAADVCAYVKQDRLFLSVDETRASIDTNELPALIALANAAFPAGHPQKITREWVRFLREQAVGAEASDNRGADAVEFTEMADALESYLPPE